MSRKKRDPITVVHHDEPIPEPKECPICKREKCDLWKKIRDKLLTPEDRRILLTKFHGDPCARCNKRWPTDHPTWCNACLDGTV